MAKERFNVTGSGPIHIAREPDGPLRVKVEHEEDVYRGLGYCHGWDRGLQMTIMRVLCQGRASEILDGGDETLEVDRFFRRMNFTGGAKASIKGLSAEHHGYLAAYSDGVNQAFAARRPFELKLLGVPSEPWTPEDSVSMARLVGYISLAQSQGDMERLVVEMVQAGVELPWLEALFPGKLEGLDVDLVKRATLGERIVPEDVRWGGQVPRVMASNNWAVSGAKTRSGCAIMANDPHLEINRLPAVWYELVIEQGDRWAISATMPGLPALLLTRNRDLAWGATYTFMDAEDAWIEDCKDGKRRTGPEDDPEWVPFEVRREVVKRKKRPSVEMVFYESHHGVLDGDPNVPGLYMSRRWASSRVGQASFEAMFGLWGATTVEEGMALLGKAEVSFNWVLADREGSIGYQMSGLLPVRKPGWSGLIPVPGWDPENDWRGFEPPERLPRQLNPEDGIIVTANDDLNHLGESTPINLDMGPWRAMRIREMLEQSDGHDVESMRAIQNDLHSPHAKAFMDVLRPLLPDTPEGRALRDWDGSYSMDSELPARFEAIHAALLKDVFGKAWGGAVHKALEQESGIFIDFYVHFDRVLLSEQSIWFGEESRETIFKRAIERALSISSKPWRAQRGLVMSHMVFGGKLPKFMGFDHGPIDLPGGKATPCQGQIYRSGGRQTSFAPSYRIVTDFGEDAAHSCLAGGVSDRRFSKWYTSDVARWLSGRLRKTQGSQFQDSEVE